MNDLVKVETAPNWYDSLVFDLKVLAFEGVVKIKHAIGKRILEDELKFEKPEYGSKRIGNLASDLKMGKTDLYNCIQFARQYEISDVSENLSWREITHDLLPKEKETIETPDLPAGQYRTLVIDPPWRYEHCKTYSREIEKEYPTMELEEIKSLKIPSAENAILFLWSPAPKIEEALEVMNAWGFSYRTSAVWNKEIIGMGYWFRGQHEFLLVGVKGNVSPPEESARVSSVIHQRRGKHSKKPEITYEIIEKMFPNQQRIELFARNKREGWKSWGNEMEP